GRGRAGSGRVGSGGRAASGMLGGVAAAQAADRVPPGAGATPGRDGQGLPPPPARTGHGGRVTAAKGPANPALVRGAPSDKAAQRGVARGVERKLVTSAPPAPYAWSVYVDHEDRPTTDAMEPGIHGVRARWIQGFMAFHLVRRM